jgi:hypothetical protein
MYMSFANAIEMCPVFSFFHGFINGQLWARRVPILFLFLK